MFPLRRSERNSGGFSWISLERTILVGGRGFEVWKLEVGGRWMDEVVEGRRREKRCGERRRRRGGIQKSLATIPRFGKLVNGDEFFKTSLCKTGLFTARIGIGELN